MGEMCLCLQHSLWSLWNIYISQYSTFSERSQILKLSL